MFRRLDVNLGEGEHTVTESVRDRRGVVLHQDVKSILTHYTEEVVEDIYGALAVQCDFELVVAVLFAHSDTGGREDIDRSAPPCGGESEVIGAELIFRVAVEVFG